MAGYINGTRKFRISSLVHSRKQNFLFHHRISFSTPWIPFSRYRNLSIAREEGDLHPTLVLNLALLLIESCGRYARCSGVPRIEDSNRLSQHPYVSSNYPADANWFFRDSHLRLADVDEGRFIEDLADVASESIESFLFHLTA